MRKVLGIAGKLVAATFIVSIVCFGVCVVDETRRTSYPDDRRAASM